MIPRTPPLSVARLSRHPARALPSLSRGTLLSRTARQQRRYGSSSQPSHTVSLPPPPLYKKPDTGALSLTTLPQSNFYKTFGRPVFKVSLSAIFVYQLVYWAWVKLEQDEIREERRGT